VEERIELKFLLDMTDYYNLRRQLALFMSEDEHTTRDHGYVLSSLYFDDMYDSATYDKADGVEFHRKFRIRTYENGRTRLEFKEKNGNISAKESILLDEPLEKALIERDYNYLKENINEPLIAKILLKMKLDNLKPVHFIDYFREAYIFNDNEVRVTFDKDIIVYDTRNPNQKYKVLEPNKVIMEVKYRKYLPDTVRKVIFAKNHQTIPYSKYLMGWLKLNNWGV